MDVKSNSHWRSLFHSDVYRKVCSNNRQNHKSFAYILVRIRILQLCVCHIPTKKDRLKCSSIHRFRFMFIILWGNIGCIKTAAFFYRIEMCYQKLEHRLNFACAHVERIRFAFMSMSFRFIRIFLFFFIYFVNR